MKVSYKWLESYFDTKLPPPEKLGELLTFLAFEVEGIERIGDDTVLDLKILADRACYALSHRGIAYEVAAGLNLKRGAPKWQTGIVASGAAVPEIKIEAPELCTFFIACRMSHLKNGPSPKWMQDLLASLGQRSINAIVDVTNFVMFDIGRPLHAFDAKKVKGAIVVRFAKEGEVMTTLDNKEIRLDSTVLVLADDEGPLALAGIKGGNRSGVTEETTEIILEAANWDPAYIRKTAQRLGIRTDASKRFENRVPPTYAKEGIEHASSLIAASVGTSETKVSECATVGVVTETSRTLSVSSAGVASKIGIPLTSSAVQDALKRLEISGKEEVDVLELTIPHFRLDLVIPEDIAEEVGRIIGYEKIPATIPPKAEVAEIPGSFYYEWKIREALIIAGFSEVMMSSFNAKGDVEVLKPLADDKKYARSNLRDNFEKALKMNAVNAPLFGTSETKIFEIGKVFPKSGEHTALAIGYSGPKKKVAENLTAAVELLSKTLGVSIKGETKDGVFEINLDEATRGLSDPAVWNSAVSAPRAEKFTTFSLYPFIVRDIALFVSTETTPEEVRKVIKENLGELVVRGPEFFDEFSKDGKKSLAFRLVFQSPDRTLSDDEVNKNMERVYSTLKAKGWEVR